MYVFSQLTVQVPIEEVITMAVAAGKAILDIYDSEVRVGLHQGTDQLAIEHRSDAACHALLEYF